MSACTFPTCPETATHVNYNGDQAVCALHVAVAVSGSFVNDAKKLDGGHG